MTGSYSKLPCLDVTSRYLVHVSNVSTSLNWKRLKDEIGRAVYGRVKFVETFEAWLGRKASDIVIQFDGSRGMENFIRLEQWWLNDHFKSNRVIVNALLKGVSRDEFFAHIRHVTDVNLLHDGGRPPRRWVDDLRQRKDRSIGVKRSHARMPVNTKSVTSGSSERIDDDEHGVVERKRSRRLPPPSEKGDKQPPHFTPMPSFKNNGGRSPMEGLVDDSASDGHSTTASTVGQPIRRATFFEPGHAHAIVANVDESEAVKDKSDIEEGELASGHTDGDEKGSSSSSEQRNTESPQSEVPIDQPQEEMGCGEPAVSEISAALSAAETRVESSSALTEQPVPDAKPRADVDVETRVCGGSSSPTIKEAAKGNPPPVSRRIGNLTKLLASRRATGASSDTNQLASTVGGDALAPSHRIRDITKLIASRKVTATTNSSGEAPSVGDGASNAIISNPSATPTISDNGSGLGALDLGGVADQGGTSPHSSVSSSRTRNLVKLVAAAKKKSSASEETFSTARLDSLASRPSVPDEAGTAQSGETDDMLPVPDAIEQGTNKDDDGEEERDPGWIDKLFEF